MNKIQIIGAGLWGRALASVFAKNNIVELVTQNEGKIIELTYQKLYNVGMNNIYIKKDFSINADYTIIAVITHAISGIIRDNLKYFQSQKNIIIASKGIDPESGEFFYDALARHGIEPLVLCGPNFASEISMGKKAASNISAKDFEIAKKVSLDLTNEYMEITPIKDITTMQLCGCYKNILSIFCGYIIATGEGRNHRAKICTDGILELMDICMALGCDSRDVLSYGGIGDIMLSCFSDESRNFRFGASLATHEKLSENISVEGINSTRMLYNKCIKIGKKPQILNYVYKLLSDNNI